MSNSAPTTSCRPIYHQEYFIFDREDLQTLTGESPVIVSVRNREGNEIELSASESRTVTVSINLVYLPVALSLYILKFLTYTGHHSLELCCGHTKSSSAQCRILLSLLSLLCKSS